MTLQTDEVSGEGVAEPRSGGLRRAVVLAIVVAATIAALASVLAIWVQRQVLDTDVYVRTSAALLDDPAVRTAVANYAVDELYRRVEVEAELRNVLPDDADRFSDVAAAALRPVAYQVVEQALRTSSFASLWERANREAHEQLVLVVKGGGNSVSTEGGVVRLGLRPIVLEATARIGIGENLAGRIPAETGTIEVLRSEELGTLQNAVRWLSAVSNFLPFVALGLYGFAIWLARDRRREALRNTGIGLVAGGVLLLLVVGSIRGIVLDRVVTEPEARDAAAAVWRILVNPLNSALWVAIVLGAIVTLGAMLAGPGGHSTAVRRSLAPYLEWRGFLIGAASAIVLVLLLTGAIDSFSRFAWLVIFAALAGFGIGALRRQALREFPDAERPPLADWLRGHWDRMSSRARAPEEELLPTDAGTSPGFKQEAAATIVAEQDPVSPTVVDPPLQAPPPDDLDRLERLADMHERGVLTDEEFATMKARLVGP